MRCLSILITLLMFGLPALAADLEAGAAIDDAQVMIELERPGDHDPGYSIGALLAPRVRGPVRNDNLFNGALQPVGDGLVRAIRTLPQSSLDDDVKAIFRQGNDELRFSEKFIADRNSSFELVGVVNRMDRAYKIVDATHRKIDNCGEIRFIYRFLYDVETSAGARVTSRLPITLNVVLNAKAAADPTPCSLVASRWIAAGNQTKNGKTLADFLRSSDGPLGALNAALVDRVEVNFQMLRLPVGDKPLMGGDAEYLLMVFRRDHVGAPFVESYLENQVDRNALMRDAAKRARFKQYILSAPAIAAVDGGILDLPIEFLTSQARSISPGGPARSQNEPYNGLLDPAEIETALHRYTASGAILQTVFTAQAFEKRLNDYSCTGCHQTRAIAGFHFPGADRPDTMTHVPGNAVLVPGSAHFFADIPRRKAVIAAFAAGRPVDYGRGFSGRPLDRYQAALAGTQLFNGWGAVCYLPPAQAADRSFASWTCADGYVCKALHSSSQEPPLGVCVGKTLEIGDPLEFGHIVEIGHHFGNDDYVRDMPPASQPFPGPPAGCQDCVASHQEADPADSSGGFPAGMLHLATCDHLRPEAKCGKVAATGFNACIAADNPFPVCLDRFTKPAGLRACDRANPCRQDYICTAPIAGLPGDPAKGSCIPPYFVFQFRVDGRPKNFSVPAID